MVDAEFEAWDYGPVCSELYHEYKVNGRNAIDTSYAEQFNPIAIFTAEELNNLMDVWEVYGIKSPEELVDETHNEDPWRNVFEPKANNLITVESMRAYFSNKEDSEMNMYDRLIQEAQESLDKEIGEGVFLTYPEDYMIEQTNKNYDLTWGLSGTTLKGYLARIR